MPHMQGMAEALHTVMRYAQRLGYLALSSALVSIPLTPIHAQVHLGPEAIGATYNIHVMTWRDIPFRSIVRQRYDFSCGSAAVATLLTYHYGLRTGENEPFLAMWQVGNRAVIQKAGFSMLDMKGYLNRRGFKTEGFRMPLDQFRTLNQPSIVLLNLNGFKHFVVVKGVRGDRVLVGDSVRGLTQYSLEDFGKMWNGIVLAVVQTPDRKSGVFNLFNEWEPWATANLASLSHNAPVNSLTAYLPPTYQITPNTDLAARIPIPF